MIEIIKNTMIEPIKMECEECKSIFTYNYEDIQTDVDTNIFGMCIHRRFVICPVCKKCNTPKTKEDPDGKVD